MLNTQLLTVHLLKEWREQRNLLLYATAALFALALAFGLIAPATLVPADIDRWFALGGAVVALVTLGCDLVPGERRRGQLGFLSRTPGALPAALLAKSFALSSGGALLALGGWTSGLLCDAFAGPKPDDVFLLQGSETSVWRQSYGLAEVSTSSVLWTLGILVPWCLSVSCWTRRSSSVLPLTALLLALLVGPHMLLVERYPVDFDLRELDVGFGLIAVVGALTAWRSFVPGLRHGHGLRTIRIGLLSTLWFVIPATAWTAERAHRYFHIDPTEVPLDLYPGALAADGRSMLLRIQRHWDGHGPTFVVRVDLESGDFEQLGSAWSDVASIGPCGRSSFVTNRFAPRDWAALLQCSGTRGEHLRGATAIDLRNGRRVPLELVGPLPEPVAGKVVEQARSRPLFHLPNGETAWFEPGTVWIRDANGMAQSIDWPEGRRPVRLIGFGVQFASQGNERIQPMLDLTRRQFIDYDAWTLNYVTPNGWLQAELGEATVKGEARPETLYRIDPDTLERRRLETEPGSRLLGMCNDGKLLTRDREGRLWRHALDYATREAVELSAPLRLDTTGNPPRRSLPFQSTPSGQEIWQLRTEGAGTCFARLDGNVLTVTAAHTDRNLVTLAGIPDDDHVLVICGQRRLERWRFGSSQREVLFRVGTR